MTVCGGVFYSVVYYIYKHLPYTVSVAEYSNYLLRLVIKQCLVFLPCLFGIYYNCVGKFRKHVHICFVQVESSALYP